MQDENLKRLIIEAKHQIQADEDQSPALRELVEDLLRSRKVGRAPQGQSLTGVYQEMVDRARQQLSQNLVSALKGFHSERMDAREWAIAQQQQAFRQILDDSQLKQLALEAQRHPPQSLLRRHALTQLVEAIRLSGKLARPHRGKFSPQFYDLLYEEAVNQTLTYICRRIDNYDPERGQNQKFMNWVNFRLDRVSIECRREFNEADVDELPDLQTLEQIPQTEQEVSLTDQIQECIEKDIDQLFSQAHIRDRPDANFRAIALARFAAKSWEEIAAEFQLKIPTLSSFFQRCCTKFAPKFQEYL